MSATQVGRTAAPPTPPLSAGDGEPRMGRRIAVHYTILIAAIIAVVVIVTSLGHGKHAQPPIAGGYDVSSGAACLGIQMNVIQSGRYVSLGNATSTLGGSLRFEHGRLTGTVACVGGQHEPIDASAASGVLTGTLGGAPLAATLKRDPPAPGTLQPLAPAAVGGTYAISPASACLGGSFVLVESGSTVKVSKSGKPYGVLTYSKGTLTGTVTCERHGGRLAVVGTAAGLTIGLVMTPPAGSPALAESVTATKQRTSDQEVIAFFLAVLVVMVLARLVGSLMPRIGQPRVMGEVLAGLLLGPSVFGVIDSQLQAKIFASDITPYINVTANLGLIFYMFLVGMEVDLGLLRGRLRSTAVISNTALGLPFMLGLGVAVPLYAVLAPGGTKFLAFALFVGVSMSITAFPVLARIVSERRMLHRPLGTLVIGSAAIDDVSCWFLIALATAVTAAATVLDVFKVIGWAILYCLVMAFIARPVIRRAAVAYEELGRVPGMWVATIFAGVILSAIVTDRIGIAVIFGGFVAGLVMPRNAGLTEEVTGRVEDFVLIILLPLFFAYTGLRTNVLLLGGGNLILITAVLAALAILGKFGGSVIAARVLRLPWRESTAIGALMNTRGLTELVVLNLALTLGVISSALFAALVVMALVTTFMAGPVLRLIDPRNEFGAPLEEELAHGAVALADSSGSVVGVAPGSTVGAAPGPGTGSAVGAARGPETAALPQIAPEADDGSVGRLGAVEPVAAGDAVVPGEPPARLGEIIVAPQNAPALAQLLGLAIPLARSDPPRELVIARLVRPARGAAIRGGLQSDRRELKQAREQAQQVVGGLVGQGLTARAVAIVSADTGADLAQLTQSSNVDLVLIDGRRPLLGDGVPKEGVGAVLRDAPCDVAVLVSRDRSPVAPAAGETITVPFGGADHDWAALEIAAVIASSTGARLKLLGARPRDGSSERSTGGSGSGPESLLANAALLARQYSGVSARFTLAAPGRDGVIAAASGAQLLVIGLSDRWQQEGLGETRRAIARAAPAPILFVRRGTRGGALDSAAGASRYGWSRA